MWSGWGVATIIAVLSLAPCVVKYLHLKPRKNNSKNNEVIAALLQKLRENNENTIPLPVIDGFLKSIGETDRQQDHGATIEDLFKKALEFNKLRGGLAILYSNDVIVEKYRRQAEERLLQGDFAEAESLLQNAKKIDLVSIVEQEKNIYARRISASESCIAAAEVAHLQYNTKSYRRAAAYYLEAASIICDIDSELFFKYINRQSQELYMLSVEFGDYTALQDAIDVSEQQLRTVERSKNPIKWAQIQNNKAGCLARMAELTNLIEYFEQASSAYEAALEEIRQDNSPIEWGIIMTNYGKTLVLLGETQKNIGILIKSIQILKCALQAINKKSHSIAWISIQNSIGYAFSILGELSSDMVYVDTAISFFKEVEKFSKIEKNQITAATAQNNIGTALIRTGQKFKDIDTINKAISYFEKALEVRTQERFPLDYAATKENIETAKSYIDKYKNGI